MEEAEIYFVALMWNLNFVSSVSGCRLISEPFQCCVLPDFVHEDCDGEGESVNGEGGGNFVERLKRELLKLKFYEKNNDLYQFRQVSGCLASYPASSWVSSLVPRLFMGV